MTLTSILMFSPEFNLEIELCNTSSYNKFKQKHYLNVYASEYNQNS